jgi:hypothetical protein
MPKTAKIPTEGIGTKETGYAGPGYGPFRCGNCVWFAFGKKLGNCSHPEVMADPEIPKDDKQRAIVHQDGCCNEFRPTRKLEDVKFEDVGL